MSKTAEPIDWKGVEPAMARQILAQGQLYLQTQAQFAVAADQRAVTCASILVSIATALVAAFIAFWDKASDGAALAGGFAGAAVLLVAAGFAAWSARPVNFHFPGNDPEQWFGGRKAKLTVMIGGETEDVHRRIRENDRIMSANQKALRAALAIAMLAPVAAIVVWKLYD